LSWQEQLILAAARRARVRLRDGREGTIVYAPGTRTAQAKENPVVRHRDRTRCGVRLDGENPDTVRAFSVNYVVAVLDAEGNVAAAP